MNKKEPEDFELTHSEKEWFHSPQIRSEFHMELKRRLLTYRQDNKVIRKREKTQEILNALHWPNFYRIAPRRFAGATIALIMALFLISGVVYAVGRYTGYIPGLGLFDQEFPIRVLSTSDSQTKEGITLKIVAAYVSQEHTSIVYTLEGIPADLFAGNDPMDPNMQRCSAGMREGMSEGVLLQLPDGQALNALGTGSLGYSKNNTYQKIVFFKSLPEGINTLTLKIPCIEGALPKSAPEDWSVAITLKETDHIQPLSILKAKEEEGTRDSFRITELIPFEDKFIVLGRYHPDDEAKDIMLPNFTQPGITATFVDVDGKPLRYNVPGDIQFFDQSEEGQFVYVVEANSASFPIVLQLDGLRYYCTGAGFQYTITLDEFPADSEIHKIDKPLSIGSCKLSLVSIKNTGTKISLLFGAEGKKVSDISVYDANDSTSFNTTRIKLSRNLISVEIRADRLMKEKQMTLSIGQVALGNLDPLRLTIDLQKYQSP